MPKYRTLIDNFFLRGGVPYPKNVLFEHDGWPKFDFGTFEPADDDARKIWDYYRQHHCNPFLTASPMSAGRIFLPACYPDPRSRELLGVRNPTDDMPKYILGADKIRVGSTDHVMGDELTYLGWPVSVLKPANDVARLIAEYHEINHAHPDLPISPFNLFDGKPFLPALEARPLRRVDYNPPNGDWPTHPKPRQMSTNYNPLNAV